MFRYNMVGHSKFCLLLLGGSLIFHETLAINQIIGITLTLLGIILYAHVKVSSSQSKLLCDLHLYQEFDLITFLLLDKR